MRKLLSGNRYYQFWILLVFCLLFFILRFPSLFEPYWYGDEGIYHVIGRGLQQGRLLYQGVWDNKPPLLYLIYALFDADQFRIRLFSLLSGIVAVIAFFLLSREMFSIRVTAAATLLFAVIFGLPSIEGNIANAENFIIPLSLLAALLIYRSVSREQKKIGKPYFIAGLLLSLSFLLKVVGVFDFAAMVTFVFFLYSPLSRRISTMKKHGLLLIKKSFPLFLGFFIPIVVTLVLFSIQGNLPYFFEGAFAENIGYVGWKNAFVIPNGLIIIKALLLLLALTVLYIKKHAFSQPALFILIWLSFSLFNAFFSGRPYVHYQLIAISSAALLFAFTLKRQETQQRLLVIILCIAVFSLLYENFQHWDSKRTIGYYGNFLSYITGKKQTRDYQAFFDKDTPRDYDIAYYIKQRTKPNDVVFLWGNSAQIYILSHTLPPGRFTVAYHIGNSEKAIDETKEAVRKTKPKYIIIMPDMNFFPFDLHDYGYRVTIDDTHIYERIF